MEIRNPYLLFLGDAPDDLAAKTGRGIADWRPEWCLGELRLPACKTTLDLPTMSVATAAEAGAKTLVVGVANRGGVIPESWYETLQEALRAGMDLASGLHQPLTAVPGLDELAAEQGRRLIDVRRPDRDFAVAAGSRRPGKRLLTVGTDCSVGKMYTSLTIEKSMKARGLAADFRATGQTGIFIVGNGVPIDAVIGDFISGAAEWLTPANEPDHWDVVEGQGSLFHPSFAGVSLGLLHGSQPDALVLCHEPTRAHMRGLPDRPMPALEKCIEENLRAAHMVNPEARFIGVSVNTRALGDGEAAELLYGIESRLGIPAIDSMRTGADRLVDGLS
ncbi:MAG: DUF1611 domain-containing protein [Alphaproteobacteria bacterium]|nr:DUF1611 domain-containing protein [Alphaproteobacteria bacterium]